MNLALETVPGAASDGAEVVMAGFGGQGMLLAGKVLAQAAMNAGLEVSWLPSYGPEMRGGTANVTVCLAPTPIGSPLVDSPRALLVMNLPSLDRTRWRASTGTVCRTGRIPKRCPMSPRWLWRARTQHCRR